MPAKPYPASRLTFRVAAPLVAAATMAGCDTWRLLAELPAPEAATVEPFPSLADGPTHADPPMPGPDPATGAAVAAGLGAEARDAAERAARLAAPVVPVEALRRDAAAARAGR